MNPKQLITYTHSPKLSEPFLWSLLHELSILKLMCNTTPLLCICSVQTYMILYMIFEGLRAKHYQLSQHMFVCIFTTHIDVFFFTKYLQRTLTKFCGLPELICLINFSRRCADNSRWPHAKLSC